jgi:dienelactone hydrolase
MAGRRCSIWPLLLLGLAACVSLPPPAARQQSAAQAASDAGWQEIRLPAGSFDLAAFVPVTHQAGDVLTIYIEGDGLAWLSSTDVSPDPTPIRPTGLRMALSHAQGNAAYLARPCQYVAAAEARNCTSTWWTDRRFAAEVVDASNQAISQLKQRFGARRLVLVGYSGGGAIAALVAARRQDVVRLVTVAGNLDHVLWTKVHFASPLSGSLNPADAWASLVKVHQIHFAGGKDSNVPHAIAEAFIARFPENGRPELRVIEEFDHACCWAENWGRIYDPGTEPGHTASPPQPH